MFSTVQQVKNPYNIFIKYGTKSQLRLHNLAPAVPNGTKISASRLFTIVPALVSGVFGNYLYMKPNENGPT